MAFIGGVLRRSALVALLVAIPASALGATLRTFGYVSFEQPDGWTAQEQNGAVAIFPEASPNVLVWINQHMGAVNDLNGFLVQVISNVQRGEVVLEQGAVQPLPLRQGIALSSGATTVAPTGERTSRLYVAMNPGNEGTLVVYASQNPEAFQAQIVVLQQILQSLSFSNVAVAPPPVPSPAPAPNSPSAAAAVPPRSEATPQRGDGGLSGLWVGTEQQTIFMASIRQMQMQWIDHYFFFSADGHYLKGAPMDWNHPDWAAECGKREAYSCGRYSFRQDKLVLRGNDGRTEEREWRVDGDRVQSASFYLYKATPAPAGFTLNGKYTSMASMPVGYLGIQTGLAVSGSDYTFTPDGRFMALSGGASTLGGGSSQRVGGNYAIKGNTIGFSPDGGPAQAASFFLWVKDGSIVDVGGRKLTRAK